MTYYRSDVAALYDYTPDAQATPPTRRPHPSRAGRIPDAPATPLTSRQYP